MSNVTSPGVGWMRQMVPFHRSARVVTVPELPTAVQADEEVQDTPLRVMSCPVRPSVGTIRQALPFQTSASVPTALPELSKRVPTAMQADSEVQATLGQDGKLGPGRGRGGLDAPPGPIPPLCQGSAVP